MTRPLALVLVLLVTGCAQSTDKYPSLALRPIESRSDAVAAPPTVEATPDATLDATIATQAAKLAQTDSAFAAAATKAETAAKARGAQTEGSDAWLAAQTALAGLEELRGDSAAVASDLESLATDRGTAGTPPYPALDALRAKAQAQVDGEDARIASVKKLLGA